MSECTFPIKGDFSTGITSSDDDAIMGIVAGAGNGIGAGHSVDMPFDATTSMGTGVRSVARLT